MNISVHRHGDLPILYIVQLEWQWLFFAIVYLGLLVRDTRLKDLIGAGWASPREFFRDCGLGILCSVLNVALAMMLLLALGAGKPQPDWLDPQSAGDLLGWIAIALTAGFTEEVVCRGYLQRQFHALTGDPASALVLQAIVFSLAHGYQQPVASMISKFLFGIVFGLLALGRKSLLPGILGHAWQDCLVGVLLVGFS